MNETSVKTIRKDGKRYAEDLKIYDKKFCILCEYEDRILNQTCCSGNDLKNFQAYNLRTCKHARYFNHVNKDFSMHSLLRSDKEFLRI